MADGLNIRFNNMPQVSNALREYLKVCSKSAEDAFVHQAKNFALNLYQVTADIAPTVSKIRADVTAHTQPGNWDIPAFFADGRMGRGLPRMWRSFLYRTRPNKKKGRPNKDAAAAREAYLGARPTTEDMRNFVVKMRSNARLYLASGWLPAVETLGGRLNGKNGEVHANRGGADIIRLKGKIVINLWNYTRGIVEMDAKHRLVDRAAAIRAADMWVYILDHMKQADRVRMAA
jgi:hypothetical protein